MKAGASRVLLSGLVQAAVGFGYTHALRQVARRWQWTNLPLGSLVPTILFATLIVAIAWHLTVLTIINLLLPGLPYPRTLLDITFGTAFGEAAVVLIWSLGYFGFHFFERYRRTEIEKWRLEAAVKDAELRALKAQMNPHFIFNCLNSVRALIAEDTERAATAVSLLAGILRYSFQSGTTQTVPLHVELETVRDCLALESIRFEERLHHTLHVEQEALGYSVPPMAVQTLVENGIKHGIAKRAQGGSIDICGRVRSGMLHITVRNTGMLVPASRGGGVGLENVRERLRLLFGADASLTLSAVDPGWVHAEIIIPIEGAKG